MRFDILLYPGFDELDAIAPFEVLSAAAGDAAGWAVRFVSLAGPGPVPAAHGARLWADAAADPAAADVLVVPGGGWIGRAPVGARAEAARGDVPRLIAAAHAAGGTVAAVCTGAMLVAAAGLLAGRPAVTHHAALDDLAAAGARVVRARVVDAGRVVTAGGVTSGLDLALWLVERYAGPAAACAVERELEYERRGTVWREPG